MKYRLTVEAKPLNYAYIAPSGATLKDAFNGCIEQVINLKKIKPPFKVNVELV